jgi:hypothetical protein
VFFGAFPQNTQGSFQNQLCFGSGNENPGPNREFTAIEFLFTPKILQWKVLASLDQPLLKQMLLCSGKWMFRVGVQERSIALQNGGNQKVSVLARGSESALGKIIGCRLESLLNRQSPIY